MKIAAPELMVEGMVGARNASFVEVAGLDVIVAVMKRGEQQPFREFVVRVERVPAPGEIVDAGLEVGAPIPHRGLEGTDGDGRPMPPA